MQNEVQTVLGLADGYFVAPGDRLVTSSDALDVPDYVRALGANFPSAHHRRLVRLDMDLNASQAAYL